jgi:hypothetical protein
MQSGQEVLGGLFVAGCDASEVFDDVEKSFNEIALAIKRKNHIHVGFCDWLSVE